MVKGGKKERPLILSPDGISVSLFSAIFLPSSSSIGSAFQSIAGPKAFPES